MPQRPDAPPTSATADAGPVAAEPAEEADRTTPAGDPPTHAATAPATVVTPPATAPSGEGGGVRMIEPRLVPIQQATDLGMVQVLKHGNLFLLTDPFGDIHPDSRGLGLYHSDTRLLSCCALRIGGGRPVMLQGSMGGELPRLDPAHEPERRPQPGRQGPSRRSTWPVGRSGSRAIG